MISQHVEQFNNNFKLIPQPKSIELLGEERFFFSDLKYLLLKGNVQNPILGQLLNKLQLCNENKTGVLSLEILEKTTGDPIKEGYVLEINNDRVNIKANDSSGIFYGCQTLCQLLEDSRDKGIPIPACRITDHPSHSYRAIHIDVKHHLDTMGYYYDLIDRLAYYKINAIIFEFEDKLRYLRQPKVAAPGAMSINEVSALTKYAKQRHIELSPLIQGLGHASYILKHPEYTHLREISDNPWAFCPKDEETYKVLFDLYLDAIEATPGSRYFHIGGDEVSTIGQCQRCRKATDIDDEFGFHVYWLNKVCEFLEQHDRIPIFWEDMFFKYAGVNDTITQYHWSSEEVTSIWKVGEQKLKQMAAQFPRNGVYMRPDYSMARHEGCIRALKFWRDNGFNVMIATAAQNNSPLFPQDDRVAVIQSFNSLAYELGIDGTLCCAWDDCSPHMETYWRGFLAFSEYSWSPKSRTLNDFEKAFAHRFFGPDCEQVESIYKNLYSATEFWQQSFLVQGQKVKEGGIEYLPEQILDVPDCSRQGLWTSNHKNLLIAAQKEIERYNDVAAQLCMLQKKSCRNHYHIDLLITLNDFQICNAKLLQALEKADVAHKSGLAAAIRDVEIVLSEFESTWRQLQTVYSKTRLLGNLNGYVPDRYFHFASQTEDMSWMVQTESKYHNLVRQWIQNNSNKTKIKSIVVSKNKIVSKEMAH